MGIADNLTNNVQSWATLAIVVVIISIILLRFKTSNAGGITCPGATNGSHVFFNTSSNLCCPGIDFTIVNASNTCGNATSAIGGVASTLDTFITALSEPKNWVAIVIIALIGFAMLKLFSNKR